MKKIINILCVISLMGFLFAPSAQATVYFYFDAEDAVIGSELPLPATAPDGIGFCQTECGGLGKKGTIESAGGAPQGAKYFQWLTVQNQKNATTHAKNTKTMPFPVVYNRTYYIGYWMRFDRIGGLDIWHEGSNTQSGDKGIEFYASRTELRWTSSAGQWGTCNGVAGAMMKNEDHRFSVWVGNPDGSMNKDILPLAANQVSYSCSNTPQLEYERWYAIVLEVEPAYQTQDGHLSLWLDGVKIIHYDNINTAEALGKEFNTIMMNGTFAQPAYDAPPHKRKFDALMVTDNWQDIVDGGYLAGVTQTPPPPTCTESWFCSAWSAWSACTNDSQSHTKTCTDANNCGTTTSKPATTETQSCTQLTTYNLTNFTRLVTDWLKTISSSPADVNQDGKVNSQDLGIMMSNWK